MSGRKVVTFISNGFSQEKLVEEKLFEILMNMQKKYFVEAQIAYTDSLTKIAIPICQKISKNFKNLMLWPCGIFEKKYIFKI